jgi:hypothetical protein
VVALCGLAASSLPEGGATTASAGRVSRAASHTPGVVELAIAVNRAIRVVTVDHEECEHCPLAAREVAR